MDVPKPLAPPTHTGARWPGRFAGQDVLVHWCRSCSPPFQGAAETLLTERLLLRLLAPPGWYREPVRSGRVSKLDDSSMIPRICGQSPTRAITQVRPKEGRRQYH